MTKYSAFGTLLKRGSTNIAFVADVSGPGLALDTEDVTTHDSPGAWEEHVATILRSGEVTVDLVYDPNEATHDTTSGGFLADLASRTAHEYSIVFPSSAT